MTTPAIDLLTKSAETCEHNAKIQQQEGDSEQAEHSFNSAKSYREAIDVLAANDSL